MNETAISP